MTAHRHAYVPMSFEEWQASPDHETSDSAYRCRLCGAQKRPVASRMGRKVGQRAKREERGLARRYGGTREGHKGGATDVATELLAVQSKAGSGWWSVRYAAELDKLPRIDGRIPALVVSNGQPGSLCRRVVVIDERDFRDLYGELTRPPVRPTMTESTPR